MCFGLFGVFHTLTLCQPDDTIAIKNGVAYYLIFRVMVPFWSLSLGGPIPNPRSSTSGFGSVPLKRFHGTPLWSQGFGFLGLLSPSLHSGRTRWKGKLSRVDDRRRVSLDSEDGQPLLYVHALLQRGEDLTII